jgi:hypothetical protein
MVSVDKVGTLIGLKQSSPIATSNQLKALQSAYSSTQLPKFETLTPLQDLKQQPTSNFFSKRL